MYHDRLRDMLSFVVQPMAFYFSLFIANMKKKKNGIRKQFYYTEQQQKCE